jgi:hypothetical protein
MAETWINMTKQKITIKNMSIFFFIKNKIMMSVSIDSVSDIYVQNLDMTNILILNAICCQIYIP